MEDTDSIVSILKDTKQLKLLSKEKTLYFQAADMVSPLNEKTYYTRLNSKYFS